MKGNNTLHLNEATMIEALQLWADATFKTSPKITGVSQTGKGSYSTTFEVVCNDPEPKETTS